MNAKISVLVVCVEVIIYLLLYSMHDSTFNFAYFSYVSRVNRGELICLTL